MDCLSKSLTTKRQNFVLLATYAGLVMSEVCLYLSTFEFSRGYKFADGVSLITDLHYNLRYKLDGVSTSLMWSRHLISNTNYTT